MPANTGRGSNLLIFVGLFNSYFLAHNRNIWPLARAGLRDHRATTALVTGRR